MTERFFGTDGIRGVANQANMTPEMAMRVGRAAGHVFQTDDRPHTILIGKDTRRSCYMIENALTAGFCSLGINVLLVGPLPTPGVSYIMRSLRCDAAVMISASHNDYQYNGIKFFGPDGFKLVDGVEDQIAALMHGDTLDTIRPQGKHVGTARRIDDAKGRYIEFAKASFPKGMRLEGLKIVVDCANGAAYQVGPHSFSELGAEVIAISDSPNGVNINERCGSVHPEEMRATVIRERADVGIAFDGDGDRIVMSDENGRLLDGNAILTVLGVDLLERGVLPENTLATTIMANGGMLRALETRGGKVCWTKVGDRYVVEAMRQHGLIIGGESSGHVVMLEHNTTGDALIAALQVLATMIRREQPLSTLANAYHAMPEAHTVVPLEGDRRPDAQALESVQEEAEETLDGSGRVVIRPSGTEPIVRIMVQHDAQRTAETLADSLAEKIRALG
jgi:phosphoglucosamine mutase